MKKYLKNRKNHSNAGTGLLILSLVLAFVFVFATVFYSDKEVSAETISGTDNDDVAVDPTGQGDGYAAVIYNNTNGLPTSEANAIAETSEGFLWIGSYGGLIRYDGNTFERIDSTTGVSSVVSLYVDSKERLWIGTNDNGVFYMEKGEIKGFSNAEDLKSYSIRSFVEDKDGNIFIATTHGLGMVDSDMVLHTIDESQINDSYICELRKDDNGVIYGETMDGAVFTLEDKKVTGYYDGNKIGLGAIISTLPDPVNPGYIYLGTEYSTIYHGKLSDVENMKKIDVAPLEYINSIEFLENQIWICADNGIGILNSDGFTALEKLPMDNSIDRMIADYEGNIWFTSSRQGVMKIVPNRFTDIYEKYDLEPQVVNSTCKYEDMLFIGTDNGLKVINVNGVVDNVKIKSIKGFDAEDEKNFVSLLDGVRIRSIIKDSKNRLWLSTYSDKGLILFDDGNVVCYTDKDGLPSNRVRTVSERSDGVIMVACSGGLALIDNGKVTEVYDESAGLANNEVLTVCEGDNGDMILGTDGEGIYIISGKKISNLIKADGLNSEVVMRIKKDEKRDVFWIVTSNSIAYMKDDKITTIKNFPYSNNFDVYEDKKDNMWILSSNGIYVVPIDELLKNEEINPVFYSIDNGLPSVSTANSYSAVDDSGNLYMACTMGVSKVNIYDSFENLNNTKMSVPFVEADGKKIYAKYDGSITIPSGAKRLTIYSYVYTYSLSNPRVTYWLDGFDSDKTTVDRSDLEPIDYTNLDGGTYYFKMKIQNSTDLSEKEISVKIIKKKAVYEKLWFKVFGAFALLFLLALLVMLYVRRKTQALIKKQNENKLFIREMIEAFAKTIDMKDKYTNGHSARVAEYTAMLTRELGYDEDTVEKYYNIALLHDIGKIGIPPEVLNKPGKLTDREFNIIKSHAAQGYKVLKDISIMPELAIGAGAHHERPDGKGYPKGLVGNEIPRVAQIIAVADTFDAMYSDRPYRKRMNFDKAVSIIKDVSGTQLTTDVVNAFMRLVKKGEFRDPEDDGGGSTEDIDNIHKKQDRKAEEAHKAEDANKVEEKQKGEEQTVEIKEAVKEQAEEIKEQAEEEKK